MSIPKTTLLLVVCFSLLLTALTVSLAAAQKTPTFTTIDFPGAIETEANGINDSGTIGGTFADASGVIHGFQATGRTFQMVDFPGATATMVYGINTQGDVLVGSYIDVAGVTHGFMFSGAYTTIDPPGSTFTNALGINNNDEIVGTFVGPKGKFHGFHDFAGNFTTLDAPNGARATELTGIQKFTDLGESGIYIDSAGIEHGFFAHKNAGTHLRTF